ARHHDGDASLHPPQLADQIGRLVRGDAARDGKDQLTTGQRHLTIPRGDQPRQAVGAGAFSASSGFFGWTLPPMTSSSATEVHLRRFVSTWGFAPRLSCRLRLAASTTST